MKEEEVSKNGPFPLPLLCIYFFHPKTHTSSIWEFCPQSKFSQPHCCTNGLATVRNNKLFLENQRFILLCGRREGFKLKLVPFRKDYPLIATEAGGHRQQYPAIIQHNFLCWTNYRTRREEKPSEWGAMAGWLHPQNLNFSFRAESSSTSKCTRQGDTPQGRKTWIL